MKQKQQETEVVDTMKGLLHDVGSPLTVLQYQLDKATDQLSDQEQIAKILETASAQVKYVNRMIVSTKQLLQNSTSDAMFSLVDALHEVVSVYGPFAAIEQIKIYEVYENDKLIQGDRALFQRICGNLILNAIEALLESGNDRIIELKTGRTKAFTYVQVSDSGPGIQEALAEDVFKPGISTKGLDRGMGLALAKDLLRKEFRASIYMDPHGSGAAFRIRFPAK